jgi:tripartite-type tricarboxylate transporter receptor subunit TctC
MAHGAYQKKLLNAGYRPDLNSSSEKMQEYIRSDLSGWEPLIKELGLKLD